MRKEYKLIEAHTMQGESAHMWLLLDEAGNPPRLPDGTMMGMFSSPPLVSGFGPREVAGEIIRCVGMAKR